ncbi:MAG TPA: N,N-dimethylformamidase beta subunit family domain-containing protein [Thermoleophilaceae bacterium]|nr:N,N-dimethylformamidase beta subunit family domain-containing protein [Thermoleophilaceae bacterium]
MESSRLVRVVFAALVLVTAGAFVLTQVLKTEMPVVLRFSVAPIYFSPNGDGVRDRVRVGFDLSETAEVSFSIIDMDGNDVRELVDDRELAGDKRWRFWWNGRDDNGDVVPDGIYRLRVVRRKEGRRLDSFKEVVVDTTAPRVALRSAEPGVVDPSNGRRVAVTVRYRGPSTRGPEFRVWRTDDGEPRIVDRFRGDERRRGVWNGRVISGDLAVDGDYAFQARVRDKAGNEALGPPGIPSARTALPGTGVAVRRLTLEGPGGVVAAGSLARLRVGPGARRFEWELRRLGSSKVLKRGKRRGATALRVRMPDDARSGVHVVRVRARGRGASWPLVVAGLPPKGVPAARPRPLVVLPAISWQGVNPFDSDLDGFADTLEDGGSIPADRPYAGGRLPAALVRQSEPLLRFLDRARLAYDLTTDLSLARAEGPALGNAPGIAVGGSAIWLPRRLRDRLLAEVTEEGKTVAVFGGESLRRSVALTGDRLRFPSPPRPDDLFGERIRPERVDPPAPLSVEEDRLRLFSTIDSLFGEFSAIDRSVSLPDDARLLSAAGRDPGEPAFVGYRLGKGTVIRVGSPQWTRQLDERALDVEVPRITKRIWQLLGR